MIFSELLERLNETDILRVSPSTKEKIRDLEELLEKEKDCTEHDDDSSDDEMMTTTTFTQPIVTPSVDEDRVAGRCDIFIYLHTQSALLLWHGTSTMVKEIVFLFFSPSIIRIQGK